MFKIQLAQFRFPHIQFLVITKAPRYIGQKWVYLDDLNEIKKKIREYKKKRGLSKMNDFHYKRLKIKPRPVIIEGKDINRGSYGEEDL